MFKDSYFLDSLSLLTFVSFESNKIAFQLSTKPDRELYFFYADLNNNLIAIRNGAKAQCTKTNIPKLLKIDLLNSENLWDYLFLRETSQTWTLQWPIVSDPLKAIFDRISYVKADNSTHKNDQIRVKAILNEIVLEEISRIQKPIFFERLVSFIDQCNNTEDLQAYFQSAASGLVQQMIALITSKFSELRESFVSGNEGGN